MAAGTRTAPLLDLFMAGTSRSPMPCSPLPPLTVASDAQAPIRYQRATHPSPALTLSQSSLSRTLAITGSRTISSGNKPSSGCVNAATGQGRERANASKSVRGQTNYGPFALSASHHGEGL